MFGNLYKGINVIVISFLVISTVSAQDAREPKITIEESPDKFTFILESDDVTIKITTDNREDFISKYPHLYRKFRNQIDGNGPAKHLSKKKELLRVEAPVIEYLLRYPDIESKLKAYKVETPVIERPFRHPDIESKLKAYKTLTGKWQRNNELIMPLIDMAASVYDKIIIEHTPDKFSLTVTKGNITRKYEESNKETFKEKFPEVYKKYKNVIENNPYVYSSTGTASTLSVEQNNWLKFKQEKHEEFRNIIENLKKQLEALKREIEWLKEHK